MNQVRITDPFWKGKQELVRTAVIPYQWDALNDQVPGAAPSYCIRNFKLAAEKIQGKTKIKYPIPRDKWEFLPKDSEKDSFHGFIFQDTDVYKWIEAVGYSLANHPDEKLEALADSAIELICKAQLENGYLDTLYAINDPDKVFTDLRDKHELYCFGHLCEGAIAYYHATKKRKLLDATERFADFIYDWFVKEDRKGYPGHEIAEMALMKLYEETGKDKYLTLCKYFVDHRGERPYYYDLERGEEPSKDLKYQYQQAHLPVREQKEAVGHAVRAVYLYSGMADLARVTGDESLRLACRELFEDITRKKMYVTGAIGSTHMGEAFTSAFDLPNDMAYAETCASIGLIFFAHRMLRLSVKREYGDVLERALYNTVLSGMAADGKSFFYVNPLEVDPARVHGDERMNFVKTVRQKWFGCACCPPNISRLLSGLGDYLTTSGEEELFLHLLIGADMDTDFGKISVEESLFEDGGLSIQISPKKAFTFYLRVPAWVDQAQVLCGETKDSNYPNYLAFEIKEDTVLSLKFIFGPRLIQADPRVSENIGKVAVTYGPFVYCLEEADNGKHLWELAIDPSTTWELSGNNLIANGYRLQESPTEALYSPYEKPHFQATKLTFVPYHAWGNRKEGEMRVYLSVR